MEIDARHGPPVPRFLTASSAKRDLFSVDTYFQEGWEDALGVAGTSVEEVVRSLAMMVLKPDAAAGRKLVPALDWLARRGYGVVAAKRLQFDRHITRAVWRYQWNIARRERKDIVDDLFEASSSLVLLLRRFGDNAVPASVELTTMKGPAEPTWQQPGQLRFALRAPCTMLNFIHTSDEPADVIRELSIYFSAAERVSLVRAALSTAQMDSDAYREALRMYSEVPEHDLLLEPSLTRLSATLAHQLPLKDVTNAMDIVEACHREMSRCDWTSISSVIDELGDRVSRWDRIVIGSHLVELDFEQWERLLG